MTHTPIDKAHADMAAAPDDDLARLRFFERLGDTELFLLLEAEAEGDQITPQVFDLAQGSVVLVFDREERLAQFVGQSAPYAAMAGRSLVHMLEAAGLGLTLNPEVAPSSFVLEPDGVEWLAQMLGNAPEEVEDHIAEVLPPKGLPQSIMEALDTKLATAGGLAAAAWLVATRDQNGGAGHLLAFADAVPGGEDALAKAVSEALIFTGLDAGTLDVGFFATDDTAMQRIAKVGLRFDLPVPDVAMPRALQPPGSDPDKPPKLR